MTGRPFPQPPAAGPALARLSVRGPVMAGLATLGLLVCLLGGWGLLAQIAGAVIAPGQLEVERNRQVVQHPDGGVVAALLVREGQEVAAGQVLIRLDGSQLQADLSVTEAQLFALLAERGRLEAERDDRPVPAFDAALPPGTGAVAAQRRLFAARRETLSRQTQQLNRRLDQIAAQIAGLAAQEAALTRQLALTQQELTAQRALLDKGLAQAPRVLTLERQEAQLTGDLGQTRAQSAEAAGRATEVQLEILRLAAQRREEAATALRDLAPREAELTGRRAALRDRLARLDIRAPVSGLVLGLQVAGPAAVIRPAEPILALVPQDRPLVVTARIAPADIDAVTPGQEVRLRLTALPGRTTPEISGRLTTVSADALSDSDSHASFYRAEIRIDPDQIARLGHRLVPGMPVEAFIATGSRAPLTYLLKPLSDYFALAFRES